MTSTDLTQPRAWIAGAKGVAILTGAGISAESGIPTFRGAGGLWNNFKPEELATPEAFARDPRLVWEWYNWRRELIAKAEPNSAHRALVKLEIAKRIFTLITQNVDGLHDRAGNGKILKLHGDIWRLRCVACGANWPDRRVPLPKLPPHCQCGGVARPNVVWFGEPLPDGMMKEAEHAVASAEVVLVIGTSANVYPAAGLIPFARQAGENGSGVKGSGVKGSGVKGSGVKIIEINTDDTPYSDLVDCALRGPAGEILPQLI